MTKSVTFPSQFSTDSDNLHFAFLPSLFTVQGNPPFAEIDLHQGCLLLRASHYGVLDTKDCVLCSRFAEHTCGYDRLIARSSCSPLSRYRYLAVVTKRIRQCDVRGNISLTTRIPFAMNTIGIGDRVIVIPRRILLRF